MTEWMGMDEWRWKWNEIDKTGIIYLNLVRIAVFPYFTDQILFAAISDKFALERGTNYKLKFT